MPVLLDIWIILEKLAVPIVLAVIAGAFAVYREVRSRNGRANAKQTEVLADKTVVETGISLFREAMATVSELKDRLKYSQEREDRLQEELDEARQKLNQMQEKINKLERELNDERFMRNQLEVQASKLEMEIQKFKDQENRKNRP